MDADYNTNDLKLISIYSFLNEIDPTLLKAIDLNVLHIPSEAEQILLNKLAETIDQNLVLYKPGYTPKGKHLCKTIKSAELTEAELALLKKSENEFSKNDLILIAYNKPVVLS